MTDFIFVMKVFILLLGAVIGFVELTWSTHCFVIVLLLNSLDKKGEA